MIEGWCYSCGDDHDDSGDCNDSSDSDDYHDDHEDDRVMIIVLTFNISRYYLTHLSR